MTQVIRFEEGSITNEEKQIKLEFNDVFNFEFIQNEFTPVHYINANAQIKKYINQMSTDQTIFVDFQFVPSYFEIKGEQPPPICVFTFCCTSGVYVLKQTSMHPNPLLKTFLSAEEGHEFIGFSLRDSQARLTEMFGEDFTINLVDIHSIKKIGNIRSIIDKYGEDILVKIASTKMRQKFWFQKKLKFDFFSFTASWSFIISHCYQKIMEKSEDKKETKETKDKKDKKNTMRKTLQDLISEWGYGKKHELMLFKGKLTPVYLYDADKDLKKFIQKISKCSFISFDFRFYSMDKNDPHYTSTFSFCCSSKVFVFVKTTTEADESLKNFLSKKRGFTFVGKETKKTLKNLKKLYGDKFKI